jgi:Reverse transcriptase (RNA-dependent DNA polymerase)
MEIQFHHTYLIWLLATWVQKLNELQVLQSVFQGCRGCLLYADDTLLFVKPQIQQLRILRKILEVFGKMSGLRINLQKSELLVTLMNEIQVEQLAGVINYKSAKFSLKYLGLPLSDKKLQKQHYKQLVDNIQD